MTPKKKVASGSSDSSTGSSSSSGSSSGSSSSGSDSSSSSDSESSSSPDDTTPAKETTKPQPEQKKTQSLRPTQRKSTDSISKKENTTAKTDEKEKVPPNKAKQTNITNAKTTKPKPNTLDSSEDESPPKINTTLNKTAPKRKAPAKPKSSATVTPKALPAKTAPPPAKAAPKAVVTPKTNPVKAPPKSNEKVSKPQQNDVKKSKKKSIFSPENSSESDTPPVNSKLTAMKTQAKVVPAQQKPRQKVSPRPSIDKPTKTIEKPKPVVKEEVKKPVPQPVKQNKSSVSSESSLTSDSSDSSSSSDSESSADSAVTSKPTRKASPLKKVTQRNIASSKHAAKENNVSDTDGEASQTVPNKPKTVTRKLTRSASARKSKHLIGKSSMFTDTDSDTESTKRSVTKSPVKRAPAKGKVKNSKRNDTKAKPAESAIIVEERKCPIDGCDSMGHLSGKHEKHFTVEACPLFHNTTPQKCKEAYNERKKHEEERKKALDAYKKSPRLQQTIEQKQYLQKIKDARMKFKTENDEDIKVVTAEKNKEPDLGNVVPEYDLKLFREAQAIASDKIEEELKTLPYTKGTKYIEMGKFEMEVWYQSPYPEDYARLPKLYLCEYCLRYMKSRTILQRHVVKCVWRHPPGEEVYRKDKICVWEVDGKKYKLYCQNLCLLAKFFLDHKTLYYDVEPFLFYVMTIMDNEGCHTVGYFSKEKNSFLNYNVSCILTLPPYQRQGYGRLLIDFSYLLTRVEGKIGSPEKPLSDLGLISYRSYWKDVLLAYLCARPGTQLSIKDISQEMAINSYDIVSTLQALGMMKYWKGKHIILKKQDVLDEYVERMKRRGPLVKDVDPSCLKWKPFVAPQPTTA
ncbi:histone acetyltransferase KAT7 [Chrysoperla carnea]|uniref:histone acetyltransferase KAT7 n=1 Tax=Chrysoperla carnea TaxID=189513 RepID=UPI001D08B4F9|nr:histone acetyltransferase KAT7 [Chrysoperla carnea]